MCLIITAVASGISGILTKIFNGKFKLGTLALMYFAAALMWCCDGIFSLIEGEPFFDISKDDAMLGGLIVILGVVIWLAILGISKIKEKHQKT